MNSLTIIGGLEVVNRNTFRVNYIKHSIAPTYVYDLGIDDYAEDGTKATFPFITHLIGKVRKCK